MALVRGASVALAAVGLISLGACAHKADGPQVYQTKKGGPAVPGIGVNSYLWQATLETLAFMPLASADPYGGVIITDWYTNPEKPDERFKATAYVLGRELRADGLRVSIFRQVRGPDGQWQNAAVNPETTGEIENKVLARARELRAQGVKS